MIIPGGQGGGGGRRRASATPLGKLPALAPGVPASCPPNFPPQAPYKPSQGLMAQPGAVPEDKQGSFCAQPRRPDGPQGGTWGRCPCHPDGKLGKLRVRGFGLPWGAVPCRATSTPSRMSPPCPSPRAPPRLSTTEWLILPLSAGLITQPERGSFPSAFQAGKLDALAIFKKYGGKEGREAKEGRKVFYLPASRLHAC